jgi:hypothetical protein
MKINKFSKLNIQKIVGQPGFEHFPTIGVVNKIDDTILFPLEQTERTIFIGSFLLENYEEIDMIRPSIIKDLEVIEFDDMNDLIKLKFSAPGNDGDIGKANRYEFKAAYNPDILSTNNKYMNGDINKREISDKHSLHVEIVYSTFIDNIPNIAGFKENFHINISKYKSKKSFSIMLRAVDLSQNYGEWSPILTIKLDKNIILSPQLRHFRVIGKEKSTALNLELKNETSQFIDNLDSTSSYSFFVIFLIGKYNYYFLEGILDS